MLKTYRIIPVVFILFLFGFTLITVSPVIAEDSGEVAELNARIVESQSQVATLTTTNAQLQEQLRAASAAAEPLNARIAELEAENATLREQQGAPADPSGREVAELNAKISQLEGKPMSSWECAWKRREMR